MLSTTRSDFFRLRRSQARLLIGAFTLLFLSACATHQEKTKIALNALAAGNPALAEQELDKLWLDKEGHIRHHGSDLLYYFDKGVFLFLQKRYDESIEIFLKAERRAEELTSVSVSREAGSFIINEKVKEYAGEDFEKALISYYLALNYLGLGQLDEALVECRKIDMKLREYNSKYSEKKNVYREDAFLRYIAGACYEAQDNLNDALISYRMSWETYTSDYQIHYGTPPFPELPKDLLRCTDSLGFTDEYERWSTQFSWATYPKQSEMEGMAQVLAVIEYGQGPYKVEEAIVLPGPNGPVKLALPAFRAQLSSFLYADVMVDGKSAGRSALAEDITGIAVKNLQDRMGRITAKMIARVAAKQVASAQAKKKWGDGAGWIASALTSATEQADTRSWLTLPAGVHLARIAVPPGEHDIVLQVTGGAGEGVNFGHVNLKAGQFAFFFHRAYDGAAPSVPVFSPNGNVAHSGGM